MFYTVYKTTNLINGKFYIGTHKTNDPNDSYLGSGKVLQSAIEKYGVSNFKKEVLFIFDNPEDMFAKEAEIVTAEFLAENNTYNLKLGGEGGFDWINSKRVPDVEACSRGGKKTGPRMFAEKKGFFSEEARKKNLDVRDAKSKASIEECVAAFQQAKTIRGACRLLGLNDKGGSFRRMKRIVEQFIG